MYTGSCHCGRVKFEVEADLSRGTMKCNCSFCPKVRNWSFIVKPEANMVNRYLFCRHV